jgi:exonuclease III
MTGQNVALLTRIDPSVTIVKSSSRVSYPIAGSTCGRTKSYSRGKARSGHVGLSKHYLAQFEITIQPESKPPRRRVKTKYLKSRTVLSTATSESKSVVYAAQARAERFTLLMAGAHFIAQPRNADRCLRREAQATVLNRLLQGSIDRLIARDHPLPVELLITGDFNDHDREAPGASGELPLSSTLQVLKLVAGRPLQTAASWISRQTDRYSSWHDQNANCVDDGAPEHSLIDHVLLSEGLRRRLYSVWMDHNETVSCAQRTSDHFPIIFEIK